MLSAGIILGLTIWSIEDIRFHLVDIRKVGAFAVLGLFLQLACRNESIISIALALLTGAIMYLVSILTKEKLGKGDAFVVMTMGIYIGFIDVIRSLWIGSILAAAMGLLIIVVRKKNIRYEMPFVPFLLGGYLVVYSCSLMGGRL